MSRTRPDYLPEASALAVLMSFCLFWFSDTVADPDLWGHLRFGQDLLRTGAIVQRDVYSYRAQEQPWINHEWLSEVIFAEIYNRQGSTGLIFAKLAVSLLMVGCCYRHLRRRGLGPFRSLILLVVVCIPFRLGLGTIRPQIFTYVCFLLELLILEHAGSRAFSPYLLVLPLLMAVWVNLHGGVLAGVAVILLWLAARIVRRLIQGNLLITKNLGDPFAFCLLGMACCLALLLNPHGAELIRFLARTATVPRPDITEWAPIAVSSLPGLIFLGLLVIAAVGLAGCRRRPGLENLLVLGVSAALPFVASRHYPLFVTALIVLGGEPIASAWNHFRPLAESARGQGLAIVAASLVLSILLASFVPARIQCIRLDPYFFTFPTRVVAFLQRGGAEGNMAVPYDWGEYVLWHLGPNVKVSNDGRRETLYSDQSARQSRDFEHGTGTWDALLKTGPATDLVLVPLRSPTVALMSRTAGWLALYRDSTCALFVRSAYPGLDRLLHTPVPGLPDNGRGLCFPGPGRE